MSEFKLYTDGTARGVACGVRPSGLVVGHGGGKPIHLLFPETMRFAPVVWHEAHRRELWTSSDGRVTIPPTKSDPEADITAFDQLVERRERGGIAPGDYGVYRVEPATEEWGYVVTCPASGRASLKRIGRWLRVSNTFYVGIGDEQALAALLERATTARVKGETTTIRLPAVPGLAVSVEAGEIVVPWPGSREEADILRRVRTLRWDKRRGAYAVSTRYSRSLAAALREVAALRTKNAEGERAMAAALATAKAEAAARAEQERRDAAAAWDTAFDRDPVRSTDFVRVTVRDGLVTVAFAYDEVANAAIRQIPGVSWHPHYSGWIVTRPDLRVLRAAVDAIDAHFRANRPDAADDDTTIARQLWPLEIAPSVGEVVRVDGKAAVVTGHGKRFRINSDHPSYEGSHLLGYEGTYGCYCYFRPATAEEAAALPAENSSERAHREKIRRIFG